ncbi:DNA-processing protein DprA [Haliovirga abyssi]|uniref:DNA processing protein DprA n=1 Tax=Haliovirga abyssi TaxID=2996794 RepID=A0AAU9DCJ4_9FUSO|nr:DNA-processing protein DprA [Haliovirga abyssi]BDU51040.1 DNA processing protein DprA [Haliovirga abyssi]
MNEWYKLHLAGLTRGEIYKLMIEFENFENIINSDLNILSLKLKIKKEKLIKIKKITDEEIMLEKSKYDKLGIKILSLKDEKYPYLLREISNPPLFLYYKGEMKIPNKTIGVIGTRKITAYGESATKKITKELIESGVTIISGLALGVDAIALNTALKSGGNVVAVVGSGLDVIYPYENKRIWEKIENEGLIISEYPIGTQPLRWNFPERNRIIVGLSNGILICESYKSGGSLITGKICLDENRELFAVPGFISYPSFEGCNNLIKRGEAKLVSNAEDILEEFNWDTDKSDIENEHIILSKEEEILYKKLVVEKNLDELIMETGYKGNNILVYLMEMEIKGIIKSISGGRYTRV